MKYRRLRYPVKTRSFQGLQVSFKDKQMWEKEGMNHSRLPNLITPNYHYVGTRYIIWGQGLHWGLHWHLTAVQSVRKEMFFLPAELAKEAGTEVLSYWMGDLGTSQDVSFTLGHVTMFFFLAWQCNSFSHPCMPFCEFLPKVYCPIKCCCTVVWQTNGFQCVRNFVSLRTLKRWVFSVLR